MNTPELLEVISTGETSRLKFKESLASPENISLEMIAMAGSVGGMILMGGKDKVGTVTGLIPDQIRYVSRKVTALADSLKPPIHILTEVVTINQERDAKNVLVLHIEEGLDKSYNADVSRESNKRLLTENPDMMRLYQHRGNLLAGELQEVYGTTIDDIDEKVFSNYFIREFGLSYDKMGLSFEQALGAKRVLRNGQLTLAGLLFFGRDPQSEKPAFTIKAVSYFGNELQGNNYRSNPLPI